MSQAHANCTEQRTAHRRRMGLFYAICGGSAVIDVNGDNQATCVFYRNVIAKADVYTASPCPKLSGQATRSVAPCAWSGATGCFSL